MLALSATNTEFTVIALIGLILLIGIVKKNAIMMIDVALEAERSERLSPEAAIRKASLLRLRPILMTTMAAMFGALPMVLNSGTGSELRRPLGISIIGGLVVSQLLTLYTTPALYVVMDRLRLGFARRTWTMRGAIVIALCAAASSLTACVMPPRYVVPSVPVPPAYKESTTAATELQPAQPRDQVSRQGWWDIFGDAQLDGLEAQISGHNPTIADAEARLRDTRASLQEEWRK